MPRRNPLSDARKSFLLPRLSPSEVSLLPELAEIDPTQSGEYVPWLLRMLKRSDIRLPEDAEKLNELLIVFHQNKRKLPSEQRDINRYKTHGELYKALKALFPTTDDGLVLDETFRFVGEVPPYQLFEVVDRRSVQRMGENTNWCTKAKDVAEKYLLHGPLYLILKKGRKFGQVHFELQQVMNVDDEPIGPKTKGIKKLLRLAGNRYYYLREWLTKGEKLEFSKLLLSEIAAGTVIDDNVWDIIDTGVLSSSQLRLFAADCAERVLMLFEKEYPDDNRPRVAIETARKFALGQATVEELAAAHGAAKSVTRSDISSVAESAAISAARSSIVGSAMSAAVSAAESALRSVAWSAPHYAEFAAKSAERAWQQQHFLKIYQGLYRNRRR